jgi:hypothetical protein
MPQGVAVGAYNGDGKLDLAVNDLNCVNFRSCGPGMVSILLSNGDGTFQNHNVEYITGTAPSFAALGDFNGDGRVDMAVVNATSNAVSILLGNGDGTFQPRIDFPAGIGANGIAAGDFSRLFVGEHSFRPLAFSARQVSAAALTFVNQNLGIKSALQADRRGSDRVRTLKVLSFTTTLSGQSLAHAWPPPKARLGTKNVSALSEARRRRNVR